jgi:hypothetical protein
MTNQNLPQPATIFAPVMVFIDNPLPKSELRMSLGAKMLASDEQEYRDLLEKIYVQFVYDVRNVVRTAIEYCDSLRRRGLSTDNSTSEHGCALLYLLIRYFDRKHAFEIGTYIGATAVCMNEARRKTGEKLTTSDVIDYGELPPWSGIRFIPFGARVALHMLEEEGTHLDFVFFDWKPDARSFDVINAMCTKDAILATHDYIPGSKVEEIVAELNQTYQNIRQGRWSLPNKDPTIMTDGFRVNACTAFFLPDELLSRVA